MSTTSSGVSGISYSNAIEFGIEHDVHAFGSVGKDWDVLEISMNGSQIPI